MYLIRLTGPYYYTSQETYRPILHYLIISSLKSSPSVRGVDFFHPSVNDLEFPRLR